ncbi:hypothetical protein D3C81_1484010 [compost metagenome]
MLASRDAGGHFAVRQAVAGHVALEQLGRHGLWRLGGLVPLGAVDDPGGALAQHFVQGDAAARNGRQRMLGQCLRLAGVAERVAGKGQPGQARQFRQPAGQGIEAVGGDAQQFQVLAIRQAGR